MGLRHRYSKKSVLGGRPLAVLSLVFVRVIPCVFVLKASCLRTVLVLSTAGAEMKELLAISLALEACCLSQS